MCGISGFISRNKIELINYYDAHQTLKHRGPDDEGYYAINDKIHINAYGDNTSNSNRTGKHIKEISQANICLGHFRLSIIDLSENAHQPFLSEDKQHVVVFNGEIYNYIEIKNELAGKGYKFKTNSDTETLLLAYKHWRENCFKKFNGMWAIAIIDIKLQKLFLSRDRFGIKPLYIYHNEDKIYFASELKFFKKLNLYLSLNETVARKYLENNIIDHNNQTFYNEICSISPAHYFVYDFRCNLLEKKEYWHLNPSNRNNLIEKDTENNLYDLFSSSLSMRMRSDVPVGTLLSGGLDSNSIVSLLCNNHNLPNGQLQTFSAVFNEKEFSELNYIKDTVYRYPQIKPSYIYPSPHNLIDDLKLLLQTIETPFRSLAVYSQFCIYRYIKQNTDVKVLLNGQGADELFAGYNDHYHYYFLELINRNQFIRILNELYCLHKYRKEYFIKNVMQTLYLASKLEKYQAIVKLFRKNKKLSKNSVFNYKYEEQHPFIEGLNEKLVHDLTISALPEYLRYEDKNSMAFSLESRLPFLDYRIVEYAAKIPSHRKINKGRNKYIMRKAFSNYIVQSILNRKDKMGFISPQEVWQKTFLKQLMTQVLLEPDPSGLLNQKNVNKRTTCYLKSHNNEDPWLIWRIFCYKYWYSAVFRN